MKSRLFCKNKKQPVKLRAAFYDSYTSRTCDLLLRRQMLYPAELMSQVVLFYIIPFRKTRWHKLFSQNPNSAFCFLR